MTKKSIVVGKRRWYIYITTRLPIEPNNNTIYWMVIFHIRCDLNIAPSICDCGFTIHLQCLIHSTSSLCVTFIERKLFQLISAFLCTNFLIFSSMGKRFWICVCVFFLVSLVAGYILMAHTSERGLINLTFELVMQKYKSHFEFVWQQQ